MATPLVAHWVARGSTVAITAAMLVTTPASEGGVMNTTKRTTARVLLAGVAALAAQVALDFIIYSQVGAAGLPGLLRP